LASDLDAFRFVLEDGKWGRLFCNGDAADLAARASELLDDPKLLNSMAEISPQGALRFDWPLVAQAIMDVYEYISPQLDDGSYEKVRLASDSRTRVRSSFSGLLRQDRGE